MASRLLRRARRRSEQYALAKLQMPQAHVLARGEKVLIAIVDGGVDTSHPELPGVVEETFDASGQATRPIRMVPPWPARSRRGAAEGRAPAARILAARLSIARSSGRRTRLYRRQSDQLGE